MTAAAQPEPSPAGAARGQRRWGLAIVLAALGAIALWTLIAWNRASVVGEEKLSALVSRQRAAVEQEADAIRYNVARSLAYLHGIPAAIADQAAVVAILAGFGPEIERSGLPQDLRAEGWLARADLKALDRHLAFVSHELGSDVIFVMNASGDCVAASNYDTKTSLVGGHFSDREYFQQPRAGARGRQYAMGRITNIPGLFFSAPVMSQGRFVGAVAAKMDIPRLSHWVDRADAFVVDGYGVVIMARDRRLEMRALEGAPVFKLSEEAREARYKRHEFDPIRFSPAQVIGHPALVRFDTSELPYAIARRAIEGDDVAIYVVSPLEAIAEIRRDTQWAFALLAVAGIAAILLAAGGAAYVFRASQHRRSMELANAALHALNAQLGEQASTDPLTGCANRRHFLQSLAQEMARGARYKGSLSVIALDLDHFKAINDTHGHAAGDEALRHFATVGRGLLRTQDMLARIGGEEFAILLPDTKAAGAANLAERLRGEIEATPVAHSGHSIRMTVSAGVIEWRQTAETPDELIQRADEALYAAKRAGRNRVVTGGEPPLAGPGTEVDRR